MYEQPQDVPPRFRDAIQSAELQSSHDSTLKRYDISALCASPLLQSLYAETLRLHVSNVILRSTLQDVIVRKWRIARGEIISMMSYPMHQDSSVYNTGSHEDPRPLDEFWADRFLVPRTTTHNRTEQTAEKASVSTTTPEKPNDATHEFSMKGLDGSWIPYGGGANICPGRQFAKQEMLLKAALLLGNFDIELVGPPANIDWRFFGTGSMGVKGKARFRIRRRRS